MSAMNRLRTIDFKCFPKASFKKTIRLPNTSMPLNPTYKTEEKREWLRRCTDELYKWQSSRDSGGDTFILHDGPPYANGRLHMGHALNKILKDIINRTQVQNGKRVSYIPGWDCHGLPIEAKALEQLLIHQRESTEAAAVAASTAGEAVPEMIGKQKKKKKVDKGKEQDRNQH